MYEQFQNIMKMGPINQIMVSCKSINVMYMIVLVNLCMFEAFTHTVWMHVCGYVCSNAYTT